MNGPVTVQRFAAADLLAMLVQAGQSEVAAIAERRRAADIAVASGRSFTARAAATGEILLCGGAIENHDRYASLWAVLSPAAGAHMIALTRRVAQFVGMLEHERVDAYVRADFGPGRRWLQMLGFACEAGPLRGLMRDGGDAMIYSRIAGGAA